MQAQHLASEGDQEGHKQQVDVPNDLPILVPKQLGQVEDVLELYPVQELSYELTEVFALAQDNLVEQLHLGLSVNLQSSPTALQTALATLSEDTQVCEASKYMEI